MTFIPNFWAMFFFWAYMALFVTGLMMFLKNIVRKDWEYEMTFPWSLRGLVYLFAAALWFVSLPVAAWWFCCGDRNRRKFAAGLLCLSAMGICFMLAGFFGLAIR